MVYQIDEAMFGPDFELKQGATMQDLASALQREFIARGWDIEVEAVNSYNGARNIDEDGRPLDESLPTEFDDVFWGISTLFNSPRLVLPDPNCELCGFPVHDELVTDSEGKPAHRSCVEQEQ